jgi:TPR repeat protein
MGKNLPKDEQKALEWARKAAAQGNRVGKLMLGGFYFKGLGVPRDLKKARLWIQKAADKGTPGAAQFLELIDKELAK